MLDKYTQPGANHDQTCAGKLECCGGRGLIRAQDIKLADLIVHGQR
jgi:hypothetical protein